MDLRLLETWCCAVRQAARGQEKPFALRQNDWVPSTIISWF
jgi:hypothetical protein